MTTIEDSFEFPVFLFDSFQGEFAEVFALCSRLCFPHKCKYGTILLSASIAQFLMRNVTEMLSESTTG